jgi:hypothetical protein
MTTLTHSKFGQGLVISESNGNITIDFNGEVKTLIVKFAGLKNEDGSDYGVAFVTPAKSSKKLNKANFMSKEEFAKSKYSTMSNDDFEDERRNDRFNTKSW